MKPPTKIDDQYGELTVLRLVDGGNSEQRTWLCKCNCGRDTVARERYLRDGHKRSCGCLLSKSHIRHGETKTRLHKIWDSMLARCEYNKHVHYNNYGGRGIYVCDEWKQYESFRDWARANGYNDTLTIDRKNVNGNYEPDNCEWKTMKEQQNNKRTNKIITYGGVSRTLSEWAECTGIPRNTLRMRICAGWDEYKALTTPVRLRTTGWRPSRGADMRERSDAT